MANDSNTIALFITGGTFDKQYNYISGELYFKDSHIEEMLERGRCTLDISVRTLMMVDSLLMTEEDREIIAFNCRKSASNKIIITHGTDSMVQTAKVLAEDNLADKTIVITGAMIPYAFGMSSDGFFNLGSALSFVQTLPPGVYIAMNGRYFNWDKVQKNRQTGYFESM
jgi:L-asparaginase